MSIDDVHTQASTPIIFLGKKKLNGLQRSCRGRHGSSLRQ
jgi:hypothetical protein